MNRAVLDTNVLVSGMINPCGPPGRIVDLVREGELELVVDDRILAEYAEVLGRLKFRTYFSAGDVRDILALLEQDSHYVVPTVHVADVPDPDDSPFLEAALAVGVPLITGNTEDFPLRRRRGAQVLTPASFIGQHADRA